MVTYAVIEDTLKGERLKGVYTSLAKANTKKRSVERKKTKGSFGASIYKFLK